MRTLKLWMLVGVLGAVGVAQGGDVQFNASDGLKIFGTYAPATGKSRGLIALFHQASGSRQEYENIAPRLNALGFATLAIDQRSGGSRFGANRTAAQVSKAVSYLDALPDLEAAVRYAKNDLKASRVLVWGSSYSAALVFLVAQRQAGEVAGVLAFSPDESLGKPNLVRDAAKGVTVPTFVTAAASEIKAAQPIFDAVASRDKVLFKPAGIGLHGSSVLANPLTGGEYWTAVEAFLKRFR